MGALEEIIIIIKKTALMISVFRLDSPAWAPFLNSGW